MEKRVLRRWGTLGVCTSLRRRAVAFGNTMYKEMDAHITETKQGESFEAMKNE